MDSSAGVARQAGIAAEREAAKEPPRAARIAGVGSWTPARVASVALLTGLAMTAALVITCVTLYDRNETRLLNLRGRELGLVLTAVVPQIQTPISSAAALANATGGDVQKFKAFMTPLAGPGRPFASASLWPLGRARLAPTAVVGQAPELTRQQASALFARSSQSGTLHVIGLLGARIPAVGYALGAPGATSGFAVYAESRLPSPRRSKQEGNNAFSDLDYAAYLGRGQRVSNLLVTSLAHLPITTRHTSEVVPFGDSALTLVVTPRVPLGGGFFHSLPWIVAVIGVIAALAAAFVTDRLARRRRRAEQLASTLDRVAAENERMYTEQRSIAQTLQQALLPDTLPEVSGLRVCARYVPATSGVEVGGDWYDVVAAGERRVLLVIGDVSGHGLRAATTMASLRHATLAYAAHDARPAALLAKLSDFVNRAPHDYFATVLCALIDVDAHRLTIASAGHLPPLIVDGEEGHFVEVEPSVPIGVRRDSDYVESSVSVPPNATLVAFTDGLVERRGELLDVGLERLRSAAVASHVSLEDLVARLPLALAFADHHDDTAIVGIRWQN